MLVGMLQAYKEMAGVWSGKEPGAACAGWRAHDHPWEGGGGGRAGRRLQRAQHGRGL